MGVTAMWSRSTEGGHAQLPSPSPTHFSARSMGVENSELFLPDRWSKPAANSRNSENFFSRMRHPVSFYRHYRRRSLLHHRPTQTIHFSFLTTFPSYAPNLT